MKIKAQLLKEKLLSRKAARKIPQIWNQALPKMF